MINKKTEEMWKIKAERKEEIKEQIINFIVLMMEEYDITTDDLE